MGTVRAAHITVLGNCTPMRAMTVVCALTYLSVVPTRVCFNHSDVTEVFVKSVLICVAPISLSAASLLVES